jgi:RNA polymerase sigma-70 factor (ECF subfamily)
MSGIDFSMLSLLRATTDEDAMWRVKTHDDHNEFSLLMKRWENPIRRLCIRMTGDAHRGEDLKQETFLRLFEKRKDYQPKGRFSTFLWRVALNICYDDLRRRARRPEILKGDENLTEGEEHELSAASLPPDVTTATAEDGELVRQALMQLPEIYRSVIILRHYENLKLSKIAEILEIPEGTVNSRMAEALTRLARALAPEFQPEAVKFRQSINPALRKEPVIL